MTIEQRQALQRVIIKTQENSPIPYLDRLCDEIAQLCDFEMVLVGKFDSEAEPKSISTLSGYLKDQHWSNFTYDLKGTPCENFIHEDFTLHSDKVYKKFPQVEFLTKNQINAYIGIRLRDPGGKPLGIFVGVRKQPIQPEDKINRIFETFARRVGLEVELLREKTYKFYQSPIKPNEEALTLALNDNQIEQLSKILSGEDSHKTPQVLCVDDEEDILEIYQENLEQSGYDVTATSSPHVALSILGRQKDRFTAVVSDIRMPLMDGIALVKLARQQQVKTPFVFVSAHLSEQDFKRNLSNESNCYLLPKPLSWKDLEQKLSEIHSESSQSLNVYS